MESIRNFKIPANIVAEADKCRQDYGCLSGQEFGLCKPAYRQGQKTGVLICGERPNCPYSSYIGSDYVCTCPVRQEIFKKYGV